MKIARLYEILYEYESEYKRAGSSHAKEFVLGKKRAISELIKEVGLENEVLRQVKKERKDRNKRLGI